MCVCRVASLKKYTHTLVSIKINEIYCSVEVTVCLLTKSVFRALPGPAHHVGAFV